MEISDMIKHIVLVPFPAQGHLMPIIYLAKRLAKQGFAATIINIDSIHETVSRSWKSTNIRLESITMELKVPKGFDSRSLADATAFMEAVNALEEPLAALLAEINARHTVSCVISDFYHVSAPSAATRVGIPSVCYWPGPATWASIQFNHSALSDAGLIPVDDSNASNIVSFLPGLKPFKAEVLPLYYHKNYYVGEHYLTLALRRLTTDQWILVNSFYELEPEEFDAIQQHLVPARFVPIGPLFPLAIADATELEVSLRPEDRQSLDWLDKRASRSVIYVSFGSVSALAQAELEELSQGLEASKQPFLMVASRELVPDLEQTFLDKFVERTARSGTGMVVNWAPQLAVLQHRAVGGFLTHCGWNSILESLSSGVSMLGWPRNSDQNTNCKLLLEDRGIGMELRDTSSDGVCRAILRLMTDEETRKRSARIESDATTAARENGSSYKNLQTFIASI